MSEYFFGLGKGWLSRRVAKAAEKEGATLVNYRGPEHGGRRHWFSGPNLGAPFDKQLAERVMAAVREAATESDRVLLGL